MKSKVTLGLGLVLVTLVISLQTQPATTTPSPTTALNWEQVLPEGPVRIWRSPHPWYTTPYHPLFVTTEREARRSNDYGDSWYTLYPPSSQSPLPLDEWISALAFDPDDPLAPTLFVARNAYAGYAEIHRTRDNGFTWECVFTTTATVHDLVAVRDDAGRLVVFATGDGEQVWRSTDGGDHWSPAATGIPAGFEIVRIFASPAFATDGTLYAIGSAVGDSLFARSTDGGETWAEVNIPGVIAARQVVFSPRYGDDGTLWIGYRRDEEPFNGVLRSTDHGTTWQDVSDGLEGEFYDGHLFGLDVSPDYPEDPALYAVQLTMHGTAAILDLYRSPAHDAGWWEQGATPSATAGELLVADRDLLFLTSRDGLWRLRTTCWEWVINGDCERATGWVMPATVATADYSTDQAHSGDRSIRAGIVGGKNRYAYSSARQRITLPATAFRATLDFWLYPVSTETQPAKLTPEMQQAITRGAPLITPAGGDAQYVFVMDDDRNILETLLWTLSDHQTWEKYTFDVSAYLGQTIWLHFGVLNDGAGGVTGMYVDDVSLVACEPPPPSQPPPQSQVVSLASVQTTPAFTVTWSGQDAGWGIAGYDIQVRDGDAEAPWTGWLTATTATVALFGGQDDHTYTFRSRAWDDFGNLEPWPANKWQDTFTTILLEPAPVLITSDKVAQPLKVHVGDQMEFQIHLCNTGNLTASVQVSDTLPSNLVLVYGPWSNLPPAPAFISNTVVWSGTLAAGEGGAIGFEATVLEAPPGGVITNAVWIDDGIHPVLRRQVTAQCWFDIYLPLILKVSVQ